MVKPIGRWINRARVLVSKAWGRRKLLHSPAPRSRRQWGTFLGVGHTWIEIHREIEHFERALKGKKYQVVDSPFNGIRVARVEGSKVKYVGWVSWATNQDPTHEAGHVYQLALYDRFLKHRFNLKKFNHNSMLAELEDQWMRGFGLGPLGSYANDSLSEKNPFDSIRRMVRKKRDIYDIVAFTMRQYPSKERFWKAIVTLYRSPEHAQMIHRLLNLESRRNQYTRGHVHALENLVTYFEQNLKK